ncbi:MAG TPA: hypothetical protein VLT87_06325 [Thermoanaerobaculia bacterium]|nr:hypothetical protein [Thermoanaerobaculia bacterium]
MEKKESLRWVEGYQKACELGQEIGETRLVYIADRESDLIELFEAAESGSATWLIRAAQNRAVEGGGLLREKVAALSRSGRGQSGPCPGPLPSRACGSPGTAAAPLPAE